MEFVHMATAYILRWNKPDYNAIVGVFHTEEYLRKFMVEHFTPQEIADSTLSDYPLKIETGRYYEPKR